MRYLSKSDYKLARDCATKLYYKKEKYPSVKDDDPYLAMLAEGGYMVGKMAQLMYPTGILLDYGSEHKKAIEKTQELLEQDSIVIFEAAIKAGNKLVRVDILEKNGNELNLIEVKAKSYDGEIGKQQFWSKRTGLIKNDWVEYLEDVTFQKLVLQEAFPNKKINSFLFMPDKTKTTSIDKLASFFKIQNQSSDNRFTNYYIEFTGDEEALRKDNFLELVKVNEEVEYLSNDVQAYAELFSESLRNGLEKIHTQINKKCRDCEFWAKDNDERSGFKECWGELADSEPHILDLYFMGGLGRGTLVDQMIQEGKTSMYDVQEEDLMGVRGERQKIQIEQTKKNEEWFHPTFGEKLKKLKYPLHFIDFETYQSAVPYHKGMRPFEKIAFQWSCHTLHSPDSEPIHSEYLNTKEYFPNFEFASKLKDVIDDGGTVLTWSSYEEAILRDIYKQLQNEKLARGYENPELEIWLKDTVRMDKDDTSTLIDMNQLCFEGYFHPEMKGKTSIKYVLPAIWNNNPNLHKISWLKQYVQKDDGEIISPYKALEQIEIAGQAEEVREGTGAMRAYEEMVYGESKSNPEVKEQWASLLREYCKLDTLAMVIIWLHWWE